MKIACISFTSKGEEISYKIKRELNHEVDIIKRLDISDELSSYIKIMFEQYEGVIFISSTGIAVRLAAPYIKDKTKDPAVVVVDDLGRYSISLLSGHIGGANELAVEVASVIGSQPIVTTASDGRGIDAVDVFAKRNNLYIENMEDAKKITAMMVEGRPVGILSELSLDLKYPNIKQQEAEGYIVVTSNQNIKFKMPHCILRPKNLNIGIGCRRGKSKEDILDLLYKVFNENNLSVNSIKSVGTIHVKKDEIGLIEACKELRCTMKSFDNKDIEGVQHMFEESDFVLSNVGVTSVAEPCAYLLGGEVIVKKKALNGVTIAVSREV